MNPTEFLRKLEADRAAETAARAQSNRLTALVKARAARSEAAAKKAAEALHLHPSDDPWSWTCRTLCGLVKKTEHVLAPRMLSVTGAAWATRGCAECFELLASWRLFGPNKPLTYRRLNKWKDGEMTMTEQVWLVENEKSLREVALENALQALWRAEWESGLKSIAADMLIGPIQTEAALREGRPVDDRAKNARRVWHVELVRMNLPKEVLAALKGA